MSIGKEGTRARGQEGKGDTDMDTDEGKDEGKDDPGIVLNVLNKPLDNDT